MGVPYFAPYIPSPEGRGFTARVDKDRQGDEEKAVRQEKEEKEKTSQTQEVSFDKVLHRGD